MRQPAGASAQDALFRPPGCQRPVFRRRGEIEYEKPIGCLGPSQSVVTLHDTWLRRAARLRERRIVLGGARSRLELEGAVGIVARNVRAWEAIVNTVLR